MHQDYSLDLKLMADDVLLAYRRQGFKAYSEEFRYPTDRVVMPGTPDARPQQINFQPDSIFVQLATIISIANAAGVMTFTSTVGLQIRDADTGYQFNAPVGIEIPAQLIAGSSAEPFILPCPYLWRPGGRCQVGLRTLNTAQLGTVIVDLYGFKLYTQPFTRQLYYPEH
jgi:hypothetical protein